MSMQAADRHLAVGGCSLAIVCLVPVALFQAKLLPRLPDPPSAVFASERIVLSPSAHPFDVPDGYLGLLSYGTTLSLLLLAKRNETAAMFLGAKLMGDGALASFNLVRQIVTFRKLCSWCTGTALATAAVIYGGRAAVAATVETLRKNM